MGKHVISKDRTTTVDVTESDSLWVISRKATLSGEPGFSAIDLDGVSVALKGKIVTDTEGILIYSIPNNETSDDTSIEIAKSGRVLAKHHGIFIDGDGNTVANAGVVSSEDSFGMQIKGEDSQLTNSGKILSGLSNAVRLDGSTSFNVTNSGVIATKGDVAALEGTGVTTGAIENDKYGKIGVISFDEQSGSVSIENKGSIASGIGALQMGIGFGDADDTLVNRGKIGGDVYFGDGDDHGDFRHGTTGDVFILGGMGDDTFVIDDASINIHELSNGGDDTIETYVSFTLGNAITDRIETLKAAGQKSIDITGNNIDNLIHGNNGANVLDGAGGEDMLAGGQGKDRLTGGDGEDHFVFGPKSGVDVVTDFTDGDLILLNLIPGIGDFDDLEGRISELTGSNDEPITIIDLGDGNKIRLLGADMDILGAEDFKIIGGIDL